MWDTAGLEGPSCVAIRGSLDSEELGRVELLYEQARASYFAGDPHVADEMFDAVEVRARVARGAFWCDAPAHVARPRRSACAARAAW